MEEKSEFEALKSVFWYTCSWYNRTIKLRRRLPLIRDFFGDAFDFNHDEHLDSFEQANDFAAFANMMDNIELKDKVTETGFDLEDLEFMDEDERRSILEEAGFDSEDFDF